MVLPGILGEAKKGGKGKGRWRLAHDRELCTLCGGCAPLCPEDALAVYETYLDIDGRKCTACGACAPGCPTGALRLVGEEGRAHRSSTTPPSSCNDSEHRWPPASSRNDSTERGPR